MNNFRYDLGELTSTGSKIRSGVAARTHEHGDALEYPTGPEYRDLAEVQSIVRQLAAGVMVTAGHPNTMPAARDRHVKIIGAVVDAHLDGGSAVVSINFDDPGSVGQDRQM